MKYIKRRMILVYPEESCAIELTTKVAEAFESRGFEVIANMGKLGYDSDEYGVDDYMLLPNGKESILELEIGERYILIRNVFRHNGTEKNVSTQIDLLEKISSMCSTTIEKVKLAKGSGERAINNKLNKILEKF